MELQYNASKLVCYFVTMPNELLIEAQEFLKEKLEQNEEW